MNDIDVVLGLLVVVATLATVARRIGVPSPILMVLGGIAIGFIPGLPAIELRPDVVFVVFLPPLLYVASVFAPLKDYKRNARAHRSAGLRHSRSARSSRHQTRSPQPRSCSASVFHSGSSPSSRARAC